MISLPANLVLEDTVERIYHENAFAENFHGLFLIRGENVVLLGEIVRPTYMLVWSHKSNKQLLLLLLLLQDLDREDDVPLRQVEYNLLASYHKRDADSKKEREEAKSQILYEQKGFCKEGGEGDGY